LIVLKATAIGTACWSAGATAGIAVTVGLCLSQAGEFSLILLDAAHGLGMFTERTLAVLIAVIVVSLILTPALIGGGRRLGQALSWLPSAPWLRGAELRDPTVGEHARDEIAMHIIVAGYGPTGREVVMKLEQVGMPYTVVELNSRTVQEEKAKGKSIMFGDVSSPDVLESAGIAEADALILTIPDENAVLRACAVARRRRPDIYIAARTRMASRATVAREIGATHVTTDEAVTAEAMADSVMRHIGACPLGPRGVGWQALTED
jgi:CPA2 family monovalent cation:H+ antiporter-2